ncbi:unnamed protein product [marine sediment metagenome]|uniref:Uncharacterized protein n=1 Tax=marine sediment metagenome TaxID=412755 RepID=X0ZJF8_9ZZZZ
MNKKAPAQNARGIHQLVDNLKKIFKANPITVKGSTITFGIILKSISIKDITISTLQNIIPVTVHMVNPKKI